MNIIETNLKWKNQLQTGNQPKLIVLHHADAVHCTIYEIHQWHLNNGWAGCGYHFFIDKKGQVYRGRPENTMGAHTLGHNQNSLGICAEGNFQIETMGDTQRNSIIEICKYLCTKYGITDIKKHSNLFSTECPGRFYPFDVIKQNSLSGGSIIIDNDILGLQRSLNKLKISDSNGKSLVEDGIYGALTKSAVMKFQKIEALYQDGIAGPLTNTAINDILSKPLLKIMSNKQNAIRYLQWRLGIKIDGAFGIQTYNAVKSYQKSLGIVADGIVGPITWYNLIR